MARIEFTAQVKDDTVIEIPKAYQGKVHGAVKVIAELPGGIVQGNGGYIAYLLENPRARKTKPMSREEAHKR